MRYISVNSKVFIQISCSNFDLIEFLCLFHFFTIKLVKNRFSLWLLLLSKTNFSIFEISFQKSLYLMISTMYVFNRRPDNYSYLIIFQQCISITCIYQYALILYHLYYCMNTLAVSKHNRNAVEIRTLQPPHVIDDNVNINNVEHNMKNTQSLGYKTLMGDLFIRFLTSDIHLLLLSAKRCICL